MRHAVPRFEVVRVHSVYGRRPPPIEIMLASLFDAVLVAAIAAVAPSPPSLSMLFPALVMLFVPHHNLLPVAAAAAAASAALALSEVARFGGHEGIATTLAIATAACTGSRQWPTTAGRKRPWR